MIMRAIALALTLLVVVGTSIHSLSKERPAEVRSPDNNLRVLFSVTDGIPSYKVFRKNTLVVNSSRIGFILKDVASLDKNFKITSVEKSAFDETWTQPWGEVKDVRNNYNRLVANLEETTSLKRKLILEFKVYNDGIGFRYEVPTQPNLNQFIILDELTEFNLTTDLTTWWIPVYSEEMDSECLYQKGLVSTLKEKAHTPLTMAGKNLFVSIHEAALMDYAGMTLYNPGAGTTLKCDLVPWANGNRVETSAPMKTPWRTIQFADKAEELTTSTLILNLNEPNKLGDVSWIKPGKYNGVWWGMHLTKHTWEGGPKHGATTDNVKKFIDFASAHKLSGVLVEGWNEGWEGDWTVSGNFNFTKPYADYDLGELSRYAKAKGVGLIGHHETGGNVRNYESQMEEAFKLLQAYDIHQLKTGYVNKLPSGERHQGQFMVRHYQRVLETAARYQVMLDVHEPVKDTGLRRTYPNMMTREGVRGTEYEAWSDGNPPSHTTILPFTRGLAGPIDYTPGIFDILFNPGGKFRVHTTLAKQLALYVVIYSPLHMAADLPENYEGNPAFQFIEDVPTDWETTRMIDGKIGEYVTTVRKDRNSQDWYLGSITNELAREFSIKLDFLTGAKKYRAAIYQDGKEANVDTNPLPIEILQQEVTAETVLKLKLASGGGTAIRFTPIN